MLHSRIVRPFPPGPLIGSVDEIEAGLEPEPVVPVRSARVVIANYRALLHDFPSSFGHDFRRRYASETCASCRATDSLCSYAIDRWILDNAAFLSLAQAQPNDVNGKVDHGAAEARGYRPTDYGRALVVPVADADPAAGAALFDIKGAGVAPGKVPAHATYSNGLEYLGVALGDYFYSWVIDRIFRRTVPGYQTVPVYAVIDLGFDLLNDWHGSGPAGLHVRRAHVREERGLQLPMSGSDDERVRLHIELILRTYGLTTASRFSCFRVEGKGAGRQIIYAGRPLTAKNEREQRSLDRLADEIGDEQLEHTNVQLALGATWDPKSAQIFDFGHVHARGLFRFPLATTARDTYTRVGRIIRQHDQAFVQPSPGLALDRDLFSRTGVNSVGFYAAQAFRDGRMNSKQIQIAMRRGLRKARV